MIVSPFSLTSFLWYFQIYFGVDLLIVKACGIFISVRKIIKKQFFIRLYFDQRVWEVIETIKGKYGGMQRYCRSQRELGLVRCPCWVGVKEWGHHIWQPWHASEWWISHGCNLSPLFSYLLSAMGDNSLSLPFSLSLSYSIFILLIVSCIFICIIYFWFSVYFNYFSLYVWVKTNYTLNFLFIVFKSTLPTLMLRFTRETNHVGSAMKIKKISYFLFLYFIN